MGFLFAVAHPVHEIPRGALITFKLGALGHGQIITGEGVGVV